MVSGEVFVPPTTSTSGITCGGLNGCPITQRSGRRQPDWIVLIVNPDELDAIIESAGVASSRSVNNFILKSGRSGPFSCTKSAPLTAFLMSLVNLRRPIDAFEESPSALSSGQAA